MTRYLLGRIALALMVALAVSALAFLVLRLSGDVAIAIAGEGARDEDLQLIRNTYGLDRPLLVQYAAWLWQTLRGDFGSSIYFKVPVSELVLQKLPTTVILGLSSLAFGLLLAVPLGVAAALWRNSWIDRMAMGITVIAQALPTFFVALVLIMVLAVWARWLPVSGSGSWLHFVMPTIALGYYVMPPFMRLIRSNMIEVLSADYVRTARAKGLPASRVIFRHALRNAIVPVVGLAAVQLGFLLGGSVVIESVFALDGLGYLAFRSISYKDFPVLQTIVLLLSVLYVALTTLSDIANVWLDPRLRNA
ncbi:ABC transporter permease [Variovorax sp. VaC1]|uniref:ABC transporter permease n=1 Tax=Variovorax sp. VaC1 TaxID=3373132 RepID=UPI0037484BD3